MDTQSKLLRSRLAAHTRYRPEDTDTGEALRRDLRAARLADHIAQVVAAAPPLTNDQREKLALMLHGVPNGAPPHE